MMCEVAADLDSWIFSFHRYFISATSRSFDSITYDIIQARIRNKFYDIIENTNHYWYSNAIKICYHRTSRFVKFHSILQRCFRAMITKYHNSSNIKHQTSNIKSQISNFKSQAQISNSKSQAQISNLKRKQQFSNIK